MLEEGLGGSYAEDRFRLITAVHEGISEEEDINIRVSWKHCTYRLRSLKLERIWLTATAAFHRYNANYSWPTFSSSSNLKLDPSLLRHVYFLTEMEREFRVQPLAKTRLPPQPHGGVIEREGGRPCCNSDASQKNYV